MVFSPRVAAANRRPLTAVAVAGLLGAALSIGPVVLESGPAYADWPCGNTGVAGTGSCTYTTPGSDTFTVPPGVTDISLAVLGAQGGSAGTPGQLNRVAGGLGGEVQTAFAV